MRVTTKDDGCVDPNTISNAQREDGWLILKTIIALRKRVQDSLRKRVQGSQLLKDLTHSLIRDFGLDRKALRVPFSDRLRPFP